MHGGYLSDKLAAPAPLVPVALAWRNSAAENELSKYSLTDATRRQVPKEDAQMPVYGHALYENNVMQYWMLILDKGKGKIISLLH
jgi:hypothetical protein